MPVTQTLVVTELGQKKETRETQQHRTLFVQLLERAINVAVSLQMLQWAAICHHGECGPMKKSQGAQHHRTLASDHGWLEMLSCHSLLKEFCLLHHRKA